MTNHRHLTAIIRIFRKSTATCELNKVTEAIIESKRKHDNACFLEKCDFERANY